MDAFDYVIVGAGTAGCVLASRLSEDPSVSVLLLEAGGSDRTIWIQLPIGYGRTYFDASINWMYDTAPVPGLVTFKVPPGQRHRPPLTVEYAAAHASASRRIGNELGVGQP